MNLFIKKIIDAKINNKIYGDGILKLLFFVEFHVNKQMVSEKIVQLSSSVKRRGLLIS